MSTIFCDENKLFQSVAKKSLPLDMPSYEPNLLKFLPCNDSGENFSGVGGLEEDLDSDLDPYSSDHFRMYESKIRRCTRSRSHDWTDCPFAHPGEKARRRDPRKFHYSGTVCPEFRRGGCSRGDNCEFAHGVFECWLHPSRYRTEACKDGRNCKRKVCFFAHTPRQLRLLPESSPPAVAAASAQCNHGHCCCSMISSPTSILAANMLYSPPLSPSPPVSPVNRGGVGGFSRLSKLRSGVFSRKDVLNELINSLEAMSYRDGSAVSTPSPISSSAVRSYFSDGLEGSKSSPITASASSSYFSDGLAVSSPIPANNITHPWIDCNTSFNGADQLTNNLMNLSPNYNSTPKTFFNGNKRDLFGELEKEISGKEEINRGGLASFGPDLGWVNELLM